ncbi:hypothetical protein ACFSTC_25660 [Nonomuraea ferruginea]
MLSGWDGAGVVERVLKQVAGGPERVAVSGEDGELTYAGLARLADAAGAAVRAGETVAILAERTRELPSPDAGRAGGGSPLGGAGHGAAARPARGPSPRG